MKRGIFITIVAMTFLFSCNVFAQDFNCKVALDYKTGTVYFNGMAQPGRMSVIIFDKDTSPDVLKGSMPAAEKHVLYNNQIVIEADGQFSVTADLGSELPEGEYTAYVGQVGYDGVREKKFYYMDNPSYQSVIDNINTRALESNIINDEFISYIEDNAYKIGFNSDYDSVITDSDKVMQLLFDYAKKIKLDRDDSVKNTKLYNSAVIIETLKEKKTLSSDEWIDSIYIADDTLTSDYKKYTSNENVLSQFFLKLDTEGAMLENFEDKILEALVLAVVKNPDGIINIKNLFEGYVTKLKSSNGIAANTKDASMDNYSKIVGDYSTVGECIDKFNQLVANNNKGTGGTGGGDRGGSSGISVTYSGTATSNNYGMPEEIPIKFNDLNSVPWAYEAISTLFSKNIIQGRTETEFAPGDDISREEFIKLAVCLFGLENSEYKGNIFEDVDETAWYSKYVNIAYSAEVCNGIDDRVFGVGKSITRQDMCVIMYNGLRNKYGLKNGKKVFADEENISSYALEAVSNMGAAGIVNGMDDNSFKPHNNATRAEASVIIYNCLNYINSL